MRYPDAATFAAAAWNTIQDDGTLFERSVSGNSVFQGPFREILGYTASLSDPRARLIDSPHFNIGLAVARFAYLLRGTNTAKEIAFYAPRVLDFSDDGEHLFGSSYGFKIFGEGRFWDMAEKLKSTENSKRLYFPIFTEKDFLRDSKDIPCAIGFLLEPREETLHATLLMRANDAFRLLPFNIFEFSLLHECLAAASSLRLGQLGYFAGTVHIRGSDIVIPENPWEPASAVAMPPMPAFGKDLLDDFLQKEEDLRLRIIPAAGESFSSEVSKLSHSLAPFWQDMLHVLASYGYFKLHKQHPRMDIQAGHTLHSLYASRIAREE